MEKLLQVYAYLTGPSGVVIFSALWAMSEALALSPAIKANGVFQLVSSAFKWAYSKVKPI